MNSYYEQDEQLYQSVYSLMGGNADSYYTMYDLSIKYIYKIIYDIVKDYHTTEDLVQETYIIIYNKINTLQDARKFYSWAGRIATNLAYRYMQNNKRELLALDSEDGAAEFIFEVADQDNEEFIPENILMDKERQRLLAEIIDGLSVEQKLSVQYFYYEEMSVSEIAEAMGCSTGTVKSRLNYARKAIKAAVIDLAENQGTKLYSLSALPLFYILFRQAVAEFAFAGATVGATAGVAGVVSGTATGVTGVVAGMTTAGSVVSGAGTSGMNVGIGGGTTMGVNAGGMMYGTGGGTTTGANVDLGDTVGGMAVGTDGGITVGTNLAVGGTVGGVPAGVGTETAVGGMATSTGAGTATGTATAVAAGVSKGLLGKIGTSIGAKIVAGVVATSLVIGGGVAVHNLVTEDKDDTTAVTTEEVVEATDADATTEEIEIATDADSTETVEENEYDKLNEEIDAFYVAALNEIYYEGTLPAEWYGSKQLNFGKVGDYYEDVEYAIVDMNDDNYHELIIRCGDNIAMVYKYDLETETCTMLFDYASAGHISMDEYHYYDNGVILLDSQDYYDVKTYEYNTIYGEYGVTWSAIYAFGHQSAYSQEECDKILEEYDTDGDGKVWIITTYENGQSVGTSYGNIEDIKFAMDCNLVNAGEINISFSSITTVITDSANSSDSASGATSISKPAVEMEANTIDPNTTDPVMKKYLEVIRGVCVDKVWPDGQKVTEDNNYDFREEYYGVLDVDGDGRKELLITITQPSFDETTLRIYDYNKNTDELVLQGHTYPDVEIYETGNILDYSANNNTYSYRVDPYFLYIYDDSTDTYSCLACVVGWDMFVQFSGFPEEYDKDGDGHIYVIQKYLDGVPLSENYENIGMDEAEYQEWLLQYVDKTGPTANYMAEPMGNVLE